MNIVEAIARTALTYPDHPALLDDAGDLSYRQLMGAISSLASLLALEGVSPGDRVELRVQGARPMIVSTLALAYLGAVSVALPGGARHDDSLARACGVTRILHNLPPERVERLGTSCPLISIQALERARRTVERVAMAHVEPDALWRIGTSSGTTGRPKAIAFTARELAIGAHLVRTVYPNTPGDRVMIATGAGMPFAFHYWLRPLYVGAAVRVPEVLPPRRLLEAIHRERITVLVTTPATAIDLANAATAPDAVHTQPSAHLRSLIVGGAAITPATQAVLRRHVCAGLHINYGSSEAGLIAVTDPALQERDPECAGRLVPWMELQAVDASGKPVPPGRPGRLRMRSPTLVAGYIPGTEGGDSAEGFRDGWFYSGDFGRVRRDGRVYLSGRKGEVLNLSGAKIDASRIETVVAEDPRVIECAAVAVTSPRGKEVIVVVAAAREPLDTEATIARCAERLGPSWAPKAVVQIDKLPRNEAGKIMRERLRKHIRFEAEPSGPKP